MKAVVGWMVVCAAGLTVYGQEASPAAGELTNPVEILKRADAATKAVDAVRYKVDYKSLSVPAEFAQFSVNGKGTVMAGERTSTGYKKYRIEAEVQTGPSAETRDVTVGSDGENYYLIDPKDKRVYVDIDPAVVGRTGQPARGLVMGEYGHANPFGDEINGEKQELKGSAKVGDVECYHVYVKYKGLGQEAEWYFGKKDFLPRRVDRIRSDPNNPTAEPIRTEQVLTELTVNPTYVADPFALKIPEGYTKIDDFAP